MAPGPFNMALFDVDNQDCNLLGQDYDEDDADDVEPVETRDGEKGNCVK